MYILAWNSPRCRTDVRPRLHCKPSTVQLHRVWTTCDFSRYWLSSAPSHEQRPHHLAVDMSSGTRLDDLMWAHLSPPSCVSSRRPISKHKSPSFGLLPEHPADNISHASGKPCRTAFPSNYGLGSTGKPNGVVRHSSPASTPHLDPFCMRRGLIKKAPEIYFMGSCSTRPARGPPKKPDTSDLYAFFCRRSDLVRVSCQESR